LARARAALKQQMDRQLAGMQPYDLGRAKAQPKGKGKPLPAPMRQALRQVPDDPGGLLRNKFMLEYQRRQQRGDTPEPSNPDGGSR
jgi:Ca-activated chloride channel family protein